MHFSRKLILLTAFMVSLGFAGSGEVHAAALVKSVQIASPDSGALLGIDNTFQVRVSVEDFLEQSGLRVNIFLYTEGGDPVVKRVFPDDEAQDPAYNNYATDLTALGVQGGNAGFVGVSSGKGAGRLVLQDRTPDGAADPPIIAQTVDGDSLVLVSTSDDSTVFMWYGRVHHTSNDSTVIRAGAFVNDPSDSDNPRSALVVSKASIDIDAERTPNPTNFRVHNGGVDADGNVWTFGADPDVNVGTNGPFRYIGQEKVDLVDNNDPATPADATDDDEVPNGTYHDVGGSVVKVSGIGTAGLNSDHGVLGIGDTLKLDVRLGTANAFRGTDDFYKVVLDIFGKERVVYQRNVLQSPRTGDVLNYNLVLGDGDFDDFDERRQYHSGLQSALDANAEPAVLPDGVTDTLAFFFVDKAGNRSKAGDANASDENAAGASAATKLLFDAKKPALDSVNGDTILPVTVDTISDGSRNLKADGYRRIGADENQVTYRLASTLDSLVIAFDGADNDKSVVIEQASLSINGARALKAGDTYTVDFTQLGIQQVKEATEGAGVVGDTTFVSTEGEDPFSVEVAAASEEIGLKTGMHTIKFTGTDVAGNVGPTLTRENVYVDVDNIDFIRSFPFGSGAEESGLDTIEAKTAVVVFRLSEPADSVSIEYKGIAMGADADSNEVDKSRAYQLVGSQLTNTTSQQKFRIPGLQHDNQYVLQVAARDQAGNWFESVDDTFWYNTDYVVAEAAKFAVKITVAADRATALTALDKDIVAGQEIGINLEALSITDGNAPTYEETATLTVSGGSGIALIEDKSTGATDNGDGTISLNGADWVIGSRDIVFRDTVSVETLSLSIEADDDSTLVGEADSVIVIHADAYSQLLVSVPDTVMQGDNFMVDVVIADKFGNQRVDDNRFVAVTTSTIGVQVPPDAVHIAKGAGSFMVNSSGWSGPLTLSVRDIAARDPEKAVETANTLGTAALHVRASGEPAPPDPEAEIDAPDQLVAEDYRGASGGGDQGGFVVLTWDASDDHDTLDKYRIYREIAVTTDADSTGALVTLEEPAAAAVHWGTVDAIPGADVMRVVVATLDSDAARFAVAAERDGQSTLKQAFGFGEGVANQYELMAQTMSRSKEAAAPVSDAPVFATLSPEALAFQAKGIVPLLKGIENDVLLSAMTYSEVVKAIDNIPPGAVPYLKVLDTPVDAGGSITVAWTRSPDDRILTTTVGNAVGSSQVYTVAGVEGYNVYRKIGDAAFELIGQAGAGEDSFADATVFNGVRYTYQVKPYDMDNITESEFEGTAMAIRNRVHDANGNPVLGLFGSDNQVGFDDFFILADQFGMTVEDASFEPAFDLSPNNKIDLNDFFTFADFFGRTAEGAGKALPISMAGLNSDARFYLDAGSELPRVGEELALLVSLQDFVELQGYGLGVSYDPQVLTYVGARVENGILGAGDFAEGQLVSRKDGLLSLAAFGDVATEGDLGLSLVFRSLREIEDSYIDIVDAEVRDGNYGLNTLATPVSVRIQTRPEVYALRNNYPNPFNPETTLKYDLPDAGDVKLEVYNMLGQVVRTLVNEHQTAGRYAIQWDATNEHGQNMSSGIYFYRVQVGGEFTDVKKMLLLK